MERRIGGWTRGERAWEQGGGVTGGLRITLARDVVSQVRVSSVSAISHIQLAVLRGEGREWSTYLWLRSCPQLIGAQGGKEVIAITTQS